MRARNAEGREKPLAFRWLRSEHVVDRVRKIIHSRHGNDDDVTVTLAIFGDAEEFAAAIFAQIDREKLSLDLQLSCFDNAVHFFSAGANVRLLPNEKESKNFHLKFPPL